MLQEPFRAFVASSFCLWGFVLGSAEDVPGLVLVHDSTRHLDSGQFAYYKVPAAAAPANRALRVEVESLSGDADLYLAPHDEVARPSFDNYVLKSATYGVEVVEVPVTFQRPLAIGIFADGRQQPAVYRLKVFIDHANSIDEYERARIASHSGAKTYEEHAASHWSREDPTEPAGAIPSNEPGGAPSGGRGQGGGAKNPRSAPRVEEKSSWVLTLLFHVLEFLVEVLV